MFNTRINFGLANCQAKSDLGVRMDKLIEVVKAERYITKRDLYKKLRIKKDECDQLLKKAEERDLVKVREFTAKTVWIIYIGGKDEQRSNANA